MDPHEHDEPYRDESDPNFIEDGDRYDRPIPARRFTKAMRSGAAVIVAAMMFAAGTPLSWVSILTAFLMLMIWIDIRSSDHDDTI